MNDDTKKKATTAPTGSTIGTAMTRLLSNKELLLVTGGGRRPPSDPKPPPSN